MNRKLGCILASLLFCSSIFAGCGGPTASGDDDSSLGGAGGVGGGDDGDGGKGGSGGSRSRGGGAGGSGGSTRGGGSGGSGSGGSGGAGGSRSGGSGGTAGSGGSGGSVSTGTGGSDATRSFTFLRDLEGATAEGATLVHNTSDVGCGNGNMEVQLDLKAGDKAKVHIPLGKAVQLQGKTISCTYVRKTDVDQTTRLWMQVLTDTGAFIESWELFPKDSCGAVRKKTVDKPMMSTELLLDVSAEMDKPWKGSIYVAECGWE